MLLVKFAIAVLCAVLSTPLFPYNTTSIRKKKCEPLCKYPNSENFSVLKILIIYIVSLLLFSFSLVFSYEVFTNYDDRQIWYLYLLPAAFPVICQFVFACVWAKRVYLSKLLPILAIAFLFIIFMPTRNFILSYQPVANSKIILPYFDNDNQNFKIATSAETIKFMEIRNRHLICTVDGENSGLGVFIIGLSSDPYNSSEEGNVSYNVKDEYTVETAVSFSFYPCKYEYSVKGPIREHYKSEEIVPLEITIENQTPYGKFGILRRDGIFAKPQIDYYLRFNMMTGEISEYSEETIL